jgi:hypothetical protein
VIPIGLAGDAMVLVRMDRGCQSAQTVVSVGL